MSNKNYGYAKLVSQNGDQFYVQCPTLVIGRKHPRSEKPPVFCSLSSSKSISRRHAKIFFDFLSLCFKISCLCKNDIFVDKKIVSAEDEPKALHDGSTIVIGDFPLLFVLPWDFSEQKTIFSTSEYLTLAFDFEKTSENKLIADKMVKNGDFKPREKILGVVKMAINESPQKKMTAENVIRVLEEKYTKESPKWMSKSNWKAEVKAVLKNKRVFFSFNERCIDSKKRPYIVENYTLKRLASKVSSQRVSMLGGRNGFPPVVKSITKAVQGPYRELPPRALPLNAQRRPPSLPFYYNLSAGRSVTRMPNTFRRMPRMFNGRSPFQINRNYDPPNFGQISVPMRGRPIGNMDAVSRMARVPPAPIKIQNSPIKTQKSPVNVEISPPLQKLIKDLEKSKGVENRKYDSKNIIKRGSQ